MSIGRDGVAGTVRRRARRRQAPRPHRSRRRASSIRGRRATIGRAGEDAQITGARGCRIFGRVPDHAAGWIGARADTACARLHRTWSRRRRPMQCLPGYRCTPPARGTSAPAASGPRSCRLRPRPPRLPGARGWRGHRFRPRYDRLASRSSSSCMPIERANRTPHPGSRCAIVAAHASREGARSGFRVRGSGFAGRDADPGFLRPGACRDGMFAEKNGHQPDGRRPVLDRERLLAR